MIMKKLKVKLAGGKSIEVEEFEQDIIDDGTMSAADYNRLLREEEEIADRLDAAERGDRALEYWQVGRLMLDHERQLEEKAKQAGLREYEAPGRTRKRLMDKVSEIRRDRGARKEQYSVHYLRKFIRYAELFTEAQASRPVHYSLQHELLYRGLGSRDRDMFLDRCETKEFTSNIKLRAAVKECLSAVGFGADETESDNLS